MAPWVFTTRLCIGLCAVALYGCTSGNSGGGSSGGDGGGGSGGGGPLIQPDKVDLLFVIDNSRSMADKQEVLSLALTDLVQAFVNPPCLGPNGEYVSQQPGSPAEPCPSGSDRGYEPVADIHLGIISTSIGGHGSDACNVTGPDTVSNDDKAHLLARTAPDSSGQPIPTYDNKGFLAWDPGAKYNPAGESDANAIANAFKDMVLGVGQIGCGYEAQLESWYRFLVDPEPYETISVVSGEAIPQGIDTVLLQQRSEFLRPDSMLAIVMLTDENDCSTRESGQFFYANQIKNANGTQFHLPAPRSECAIDPNDPCCQSCAQIADGCPDDPTCFNPDGSLRLLDDVQDSVNLRCFDQKRRFGIDFLYPVDRYTQALTSSTITNRAGELVPNPIFSDLNPNDNYTNIRDPGLVVFTGIVGVPWQQLVRDAQNPGAGFKNATELTNAGTWDVILGDPANYDPPDSPFMIESVAQRSGIQNPNPINGHDWTINSNNDLQYACVFPLLSPRDCTSSLTGSCDCSSAPDNLSNPLCASNPNDGGNNTLQVAAKAYPGIRHLSLLKSIGTQGVTASICPVQANDPADASYAYRPAIRALLERLATRL